MDCGCYAMTDGTKKSTRESWGRLRSEAPGFCRSNSQQDRKNNGLGEVCSSLKLKFRVTWLRFTGRQSVVELVCRVHHSRTMLNGWQGFFLCLTCNQECKNQILCCISNSRGSGFCGLQLPGWPSCCCFGVLQWKTTSTLTGWWRVRAARQGTHFVWTSLHLQSEAQTRRDHLRCLARQARSYLEWEPHLCLNQLLQLLISKW